MLSCDAALGRLLSHKIVVQDVLILVFGNEWANKLDFSTLQQLPSDFLGPQHQRRQADIIWQVGFHDSSRLMVVVIEVQTSVDRFMALRVCTYTSLLYERLVRQHLLSESGRLPFARVVVVYNGTRRWKAPRNLSRLVEPIEGMPPAVMPRFDYVVVELQKLARRPPRTLPPVLGAIALCESNPTLDRVKRVVARLRPRLAKRKDPTLGRTLAEYFSGYFLPKHLPGEEIPLLETLAEVEALMNERAVLWYERWRREGKEEGVREGLELGRQEGIQLGRQEGIQLGRQEGIEQGRRQGEAEFLLRLLHRKFGSVPEDIQERLRDAEPDQLLEWGERLVTANSLDEVFQ